MREPRFGGAIDHEHGKHIAVRGGPCQTGMVLDRKSRVKR